MARKKSKPQERMEANTVVKHGGKIDLLKLWKEEEDKEADPTLLDKLQSNASEVRPAIQN